MVSKKLIKELQEIYQQESGKKISIEEADRMGNDLVQYFELLIKIDQRDKRQGRQRVSRHLPKKVRGKTKVGDSKSKG